MARVLPIGACDNAAPARRPLVRTLATLPDGWTLLLDRCIGGESGRYVEAVIVHAEIGVALIEEAPRDASLGRATLCRLLERERFADYFPGDLPVVALSAAGDHPAALGEQLAAAFDAAPRLSISDRDWAYAVIELLLQSDRHDAGPGDEVVETLEAEPVFQSPRAMAALRVSPDRVLLVPVAPKRPPSAGYAVRMPPRGRRIAATTWSGFVGAIGAMIWVFGYHLEREPGLGTASRAEVAMPAASQSASFTAEASPPPPVLDGPRSAIGSEPVATAARSAPAFETLAPPWPAAAAHRAKARRAAKGSAGFGAGTRHVKCADWLHQNRPGGSDYDGPRVAACSRPR